MSAHDALTHRGGAIDPVCGMQVAGDTPFRTEHEGQTLLFCSERCRARFCGIAADLPGRAARRARTAAWTRHACRRARRPRHPRRPRCTSARCTLRCASPAPAPVQSAAWRSSRNCRRMTRRQVPSSRVSAAASGRRCRRPRSSCCWLCAATALTRFPSPRGQGSRCCGDPKPAARHDPRSTDSRGARCR